MDWYSRYVVAWSLSNTLDAGFCVEALEQALSKGQPEVFSTDQGGEAFIGLLERHQVSIGMDGRQGALHRQHLCRVGVSHGLWGWTRSRCAGGGRGPSPAAGPTTPS